jgi:phage gp29-like protein
MATTPQLATRPGKGEIVTNEILVSLQRTTLGLSTAFGGMTDPTSIWNAMISDDQRAYWYYRELEEKDEDVASSLEMLKLSVLSREHGVTPGDDSQDSLAASEFIKQQFTGIKNFQQKLDAILDAAAYGVTISELMFDVSMGQAALLDIKDCPQELFCFNPRPYAQIGPLRFMRTLFDVMGGEIVPENKFLVMSYRPRNRNRRGRPLLRSVFWPSWFKRQCIRFWLRFGEKGPGTAVVKYAQGATDEEKQKALEAAESIVEKIACAVPENFSMVEQLLTAARSQNPDVYKQLVERNETAITRRILGQTLTSRGSDQGSGSRALGQVHQDQQHMKTRELALSLEDAINDQVIRPLVLWNFGPNCPMPKWTIEKDSEQDLDQRSQIDVRLQQMGAPITKAYVQETYGLPEPQASDEVLTPQAAPVTQGNIPNADLNADPNADPSAVQYDEAEKNAADVRALFDVFKKDSRTIFESRIQQLAAEAMLNGGAK